VEWEAGIDYRRSPVFPAAIYSGMLYLNLQGRDPQGCVPAGQADALAAGLRGKLLALRSPDEGEPLINDVYTCEQLFHGPAAAQAPDLLIDNYASGWSLQARSYTPSAGEVHNRYFVGPQGNYGWHSRVGVFVFHGPAFGRGPVAAHGHVLDVPATLLHLLGLAVPEDYDGRPLADSFRDGYLAAQPVRRGAGDGAAGQSGAARQAEGVGLSEAENSLLADHLRALGYLE
jgi:predicted AlkP superfamily phosphohydrolase/phosphomutase